MMIEDTKAQELRAIHRDAFLAALEFCPSSAAHVALQAMIQWPAICAARDVEIKNIMETTP